MKYKDKITGVVYTKIKCPTCGKKSLVSFERQDICPSCGSTFAIELKRKEKKIKSSVLLLLSGVGAFFGALVAIFASNRIEALVWAIPLGIIIGFITPTLIYIILWLIYIYIFS